MGRRSGRITASLVAVVTLISLGLGAAGVANAAPRTAAPVQAVPISGTTSTGGAFNGTFDVTQFANQGGQLNAIGTLAGTITDATGNVVGSVSQQIAMPVDLSQSTGSCQVLDLVLGPLDLNLLGLVVHLDQVHLNITAQQGPGNLLGNLLCAVAGLLNGPTGLNAILTQIANLLNQLLGAL
jgi:hypothetical protein